MSAPEKITLYVEYDEDGLWYVTSLEPRGLLVAERTFEEALAAVPKALEAVLQQSQEASYKATSERYLAALKAVYEMRDNPHAVATLISEAISPLGTIDNEDLERARTEIERIERKS